MRAWPEPVQRVAAFLREAGAEARLEEFPAGTKTAQDAAAAVGCELGQIVKTLVFDGDGRVVVVLVPGDRRADAAKVAAAVDAGRARVVPAHDVERVTGFTAGAVGPFALPRVSAVLLDQRLLAREIVWVGAGSPRHVAGLAPGELLRLARARPADVVEDGG